MEVLHITPTRNIPSIEKYGIQCTKPLLPQFEKYASYYIKDYDKSVGLIFTTVEGQNLQNKYLKDFSYWRMWGSPRNKILHKLGLEWNKEWEKVYNIGSSFFEYLIPVEEHFTILSVNVPDDTKSTTCIHNQSVGKEGMNHLFGDMDPQYEHNDKVLMLFNQPLFQFKVVGILNVMVKRNSKISISLNF